jgi:hypothetical protein
MCVRYYLIISEDGTAAAAAAPRRSFAWASDDFCRPSADGDPTHYEQSNIPTKTGSSHLGQQRMTPFAPTFLPCTAAA